MLNNLIEITIEPLLVDQGVSLKEKQDNPERQFELIYSDYQKINKRRSYNRHNLYPIKSLS